MISKHIPDDIPHQMKILNMVIHILMHFCSLVSIVECCKPLKSVRHPKKCDVISDVKPFSPKVTFIDELCDYVP